MFNYVYLLLEKLTHFKRGNKKPYLFSEKILFEIDNVRLLYNKYL